MSPESIVSLISGAGVAGIFCILFVVGAIFPKSYVDDLKEERDALRQDIQSQTVRADAAVAAASAARDVLAALQAGVALGHQPRQQELESNKMPDQPVLGKTGQA